MYVNAPLCQAELLNRQMATFSPDTGFRLQNNELCQNYSAQRIIGRINVLCQKETCRGLTVDREEY